MVNSLIRLEVYAKINRKQERSFVYFFSPRQSKYFLKKIKTYATGQSPNSLHGCQEPDDQGNPYETEARVMEQMIRRIIRAAVESFPINRTKKAEILQRLTKENLHGGEHHEP